MNHDELLEVKRVAINNVVILKDSENFMNLCVSLDDVDLYKYIQHRFLNRFDAFEYIKRGKANLNDIIRYALNTRANIHYGWASVEFIKSGRLKDIYVDDATYFGKEKLIAYTQHGVVYHYLSILYGNAYNDVYVLMLRTLETDTKLRGRLRMVLSVYFEEYVPTDDYRNDHYVYRRVPSLKIDHDKATALYKACTGEEPSYYKKSLSGYLYE